MAKKSAAPKKAAPKKAAPTKKAAPKKGGSKSENPVIENIIKMTNPFTRLTDSVINDTKNNIEKYKSNHKSNFRP